MKRNGLIERATAETKVKVYIKLDGKGNYDINTGIPFLDHMLSQLSRHSLIDLEVNCIGDLEIDAHHSVEDIGITLGQAFTKAIGDKRGIHRFGYAYAPLDESLSRTVVDISGRPTLIYNVIFAKEKVGEFELELIREFFQAFVNHAMITLHIDNLRGENSHHQCESIFKSFALALKEAVKLDEQKIELVPSTKGIL